MKAHSSNQMHLAYLISYIFPPIYRWGVCSALLRVLCAQFIHDLLIAGLTAANAVKIAARVLADGHSLNGKGAVHIAEIALVLGRGSVLDAHGLASF